jgi:undecaprenyl-diphosphatase
MNNFNLNTDLFNMFFSLSHQSIFFDFLGIFLADYLQYILFIFLLYLFFSKKHKKQNRTMVVVATMSAFFARYIIKPLILFFYTEPRPFIFFPEIQPLIKIWKIENFQSFPSGHALIFFALATTIFLFNKKLGLFFMISAILISISRVYVGVHWPFDILAGAVLGILTGFFMYYFYKKLNKNKIIK